MQKTALVTGASRGIGLEFARLLAANGHSLVLVSRNSNELESVRQICVEQYGVPVRCYARDLSQPGATPDLWREIESAGVAVDILINNAGSGLYGPLAEQDLPAVTAMVEVDVVALTVLTRLALPGM